MKTQPLDAFNARFVLCAIFAAAFSTSALAEPTEITIAKEYGIGYLPYMIMENDKLVEKHAAALGLKDLKITWQTFGGSVEFMLRSGSINKKPASWRDLFFPNAHDSSGS